MKAKIQIRINHTDFTWIPWTAGCWNLKRIWRSKIIDNHIGILWFALDINIWLED